MNHERIDAHQHFWDPSRGDYGWLTPELQSLYRVFGPADLKPLREATHVARTVVVQAAPTVDETRYLLDLASDDVSIAGIVGWVPLDAPNSVELIDELAREPKLKGVRPMLQDLPDDRWIENPALTPAIHALIKNDLAFDAYISRHMPSLKVFAAAFLFKLRIVVDHGAKPQIRDGHAGWQVGGRHRRIGCFAAKAGLQTLGSGDGIRACLVSGHAQALCRSSSRLFGPERLMWGSDWPVLNLNGDYAQWSDAARQLTAHLDVSAQQAIFGDTAREFYRL